MKRKWLLLIVALALPGMIFTFLKYFGKNEFDVPVMFSSGTISVPGACTTSVVAPYEIQKSSKIPIRGLTAVAFVASHQGKELDGYRFQLDRIIAEFEGSDFDVIIVDTTRKNLSDVLLSSGDYEQEMNCHFLLDEKRSVVLVDGSRHIRGQYEASQKDLERLAVEVKILLKNY